MSLTSGWDRSSRFDHRQLIVFLSIVLADFTKVDAPKVAVFKHDAFAVWVFNFLLLFQACSMVFTPILDAAAKSYVSAAGAFMFQNGLVGFQVQLG